MRNRHVIQQFDRGAIVDGLQDLKSTENILVIKGGASMMERSEWIRFLESQAGFQPDRRHFDPNWAAHDAIRNAKKHNLLDEETSLADDASSYEQISAADWWEISYQPDREIAYAYSKTAQPLHTDNAWFSDPAEINFFIMAKQARSGGQQIIYPVSRLIDDLEADDPSLLKDLTNTQVEIRKGDNDFANHTTIIRVEAQPKIFWNYYRTVKDDPCVASLCERSFEFLRNKVESNSIEIVHLETGDCLAFNDLHMLHGRTAYEAEMPRDRVLLHSMWKLG